MIIQTEGRKLLNKLFTQKFSELKGNSCLEIEMLSKGPNNEFLKLYTEGISLHYFKTLG